jgi:hypothetical protein
VIEAIVAYEPPATLGHTLHRPPDNLYSSDNEPMAALSRVVVAEASIALAARFISRNDPGDVEATLTFFRKLQVDCF